MQHILSTLDSKLNKLALSRVECAISNICSFKALLCDNSDQLNAINDTLTHLKEAQNTLKALIE